MYSKFVKGLKALVIVVYLLVILFAENKLQYLLMAGIGYWFINFFIEHLVRMDPELIFNTETYDMLDRRVRFLIFNFVSFTVLTCIAVPTGLYSQCAGIAVLLLVLSAVTKLDRFVDL